MYNIVNNRFVCFLSVCFISLLQLIQNKIPLTIFKIIWNKILDIKLQYSTATVEFQEMVEAFYWKNIRITSMYL